MRDGFSGLAYTDFPPGTGAESGPIAVSGAHQPRDQAEDESRRTFPDGNSADAGDGEAEVHRGAQMGQEEYLDMSKLEEMDELSKKAEG